jgi:L-alanine-DL-glutamate epimerase-like enolase superfamily enzyme
MIASNKTSTVRENIRITGLKVSTYRIPTDFPESDGTIKWNSTTLVLVELTAGGKSGIGYTYGNISIATLIDSLLREVVVGKNIFENTLITQNLIRTIRNNGTNGIAMMAVSAVDIALWDLKAKIINLPLCLLLGQTRDSILLYGSGGFTSYSESQLQEQFESWMRFGISHFKMKVARHPDYDIYRVQEARRIIKDDAGLFVDAKGGYTRRQAVEMANRFEGFNVTMFEEPVSSDDLDGLRFIREHVPAKINIAAGEYGYTLPYYENMLKAGAVDILQADATRCGGITGFLKVSSLCEAFQVPFSSHYAPSLHLHPALGTSSFYIAEYFHDHVRIENMLFDGVPAPFDGKLRADLSLMGIGLIFKYEDAKKYAI